MSRMMFRIAGSIVVLVLTLSMHTPGQAAPQTALMPNQTINIAHFFKPPQNMDAATAANHFDTIVLTNGDNVYLNQLAATGFGSTVPQYFRADGIQDPGSCTDSPLNNQVAYRTGDFCNISQNHPDWFLLDSDGRRITVTSGGEYYRLDQSNPGWREFFLSRVMESQNQHGWSGLFLDNVEGSLSKFFGPRPVRYPTDVSYQAAIEGFLNYLHVNYSQRHERPIIGNIVARDDEEVWFNYLQYLDGAMTERFAVDWRETSYLTPNQWNEDMVQMERTQANGNSVILVAPGNQWDVNRQRFAFASYLLISNGRAAFRYSNADSYRQAWLYDNYRINLGNPLGPRYLSGTAWRRDFTNGYVVVDPTNLLANIVIPSFADAPPTHRFFRYIETLYRAGITRGCSLSPLEFCPQDYVTRGEMAVFLERAMGNFSPRPSPTRMFADVPYPGLEPFTPFIEELYNDRITAGCSQDPLKYCPQNYVTRGEMAVFIERALGNFSPRPSPTRMFADVPYPGLEAFTPFIEELYNDRITSGCQQSPLKYCPQNNVTRGEMAVFLVRAFNLTVVWGY